jgi:hypothetical protein
LAIVSATAGWRPARWLVFIFLRFYVFGNRYCSHVFTLLSGLE